MNTLLAARSQTSELDLDTDAAVVNAVDVEQLDLLFRSSKLTIVGNVLGSLFIAWGMWSVLEPSVILGWFACVVVLVIARLVLVSQYLKRATGPSRSPMWLSAFMLGAFLSGCTWGATSIAFSMTDSVPHHALLVLMILGMSVAGIITNAVKIRVYVSFLLPSVLPLIAVSLIVDAPTSMVIGVSTAVFSIVMILLARALNRTLLNTIQLSQERRFLADELAVSVARLRDSNTQIGQELELREQAEKTAQESTERFQDFAQSASDFFWSMDADLRFDFFSNRFTEVTGVKVSQLLGLTREQSGMPPGLEPAEWIKHLTDLAAHRPFRNFTHARQRSDGSVVYVSINGQPVFAADGTFVGYRGSGTDVTERVEARARLEQATESAEAASAAKTRFLATVSHEIRTPLHAIVGVSEVLSESALAPEQRKLVSVFSHAGEHLLSLVNGMLDLAKLESDDLVIEHEMFDLRVLLATRENMYSFVTQEKGVTFNVIIDESTPYIVHGDRMRLEGVLVNLLSNAVKFTPEGGVRLQVSEIGEGHDRRSKARGFEGVLFTVCDTGIGIPEERHEDIFEDFIQVDASISRAYGGSGLGLAICHRILAKMGGDISVNSVIGEGSQFHVRLPLPRASNSELRSDPLGSSVSDDEHHGASATANAASRAHQRRPTILLVDDSEDNRLLVKVYLKTSRVNIVEAVNGREALESFKTGHFDLVLMDIHMPVMDGIESTTHMREWETENAMKPTPIVALTADVLTLDDSQAWQHGFTEYVPKPIRKEELLRGVRRLLSQVEEAAAAS